MSIECVFWGFLFSRCLSYCLEVLLSGFPSEHEWSVVTFVSIQLLRKAI